MFYAHSSGEDSTQCQLLSEHLKSVSKLTGDFADYFGARCWGEIAGLLHDAGKYSSEFQQRLQGSSIKVDHSTAGAKIAQEYYCQTGSLLAYVIAGHHSGLPDGGNEANESSLWGRLCKVLPTYDAFFDEILLETCMPQINLGKTTRQGFSLAFFVRMLYSCLVDADFLDTEQFYSQEKASYRGILPDLNELEQKLNTYIDNIVVNSQDTVVNRERKYVRICCQKTAEEERGIFTLSVPTGGGKTLSSLEFALKHAQKHGMKRIIYAIPFTSIIEQNAAVFRRALGDDAVLEHHSNFGFDEDDNSLNYSLRLASENWDAPVVVTTNVQFFESLMSNKSSRCRKLHNIANSVIILDEAQTLPDQLLYPCLAILEELSARYGSSIVLCTATQPNLENLWSKGINPLEIIPDAERLYDVLSKRVKVRDAGSLTDDELAERLLVLNQVLCVVNTRKHAKNLYKLLPEAKGNYHLSACMSPTHRSDQIRAIRQRLERGEQCRVISTQLIEAGVDVDFPTVYRASAGIDSIAQAAGRCNREGKRNEGEVWVFKPEQGVPDGWFLRMANLGDKVLREYDDPMSPQAIKQFFEFRFSLDREQLDQHNILRRFEETAKQLRFPFKEVAEEFKFIDDVTVPLVIACRDDGCSDILRKVEYSKFPARFARSLQKHTISVMPWEMQAYDKAGLVSKVAGLFNVLEDEYYYDENLGLLPIGNVDTRLLVY